MIAYKNNKDTRRQKLVRASLNTLRCFTIGSGDIHIWDMFLLLTSADCLWQLNCVFTFSGEDQIKPLSTRLKPQINSSTRMMAPPRESVEILNQRKAPNRIGFWFRNNNKIISFFCFEYRQK